MPFQRVRCTILIIRTASMTLVLVWIIRRPRQNIGGVFISENLL
jgi:hypothetical protein